MLERIYRELYDCSRGLYLKSGDSEFDSESDSGPEFDFESDSKLGYEIVNDDGERVGDVDGDGDEGYDFI